MPVQEHMLQGVGKVAGIGGIGFGVFLLLFREVIRKNIFPTLSDDEAYRLIKQFMYLTFGIALAGIAAWTFITVAASTPAGSYARHGIHFLEPSRDISGTWTANVKYGWGDTYQETFTFEVNGHDLSGLATYVRGPNPIAEGVIEGDRLTFHTVSYTELDGKRYQEKHQYKGTINGDAIDFVLETDSGYMTVLPLKFVARKQTVTPVAVQVSSNS